MITTYKTRFAVVYVGAPYGDNEFGRIVSKHRTRELAEKKLASLRSNPKYYGSNATIKEIVA